MTTRERSTSSSTDPPSRGEVVLGVDTHGEVHVAAVISPLGKILGTESFPATAAGYRQLLVWARKRGTVRRAGVEGTGTFGAGLSRYLPAPGSTSSPRTPRSRPAPRRSTSSRPSWSSPTPPCGNACRASATPSCSAPARASARTMVVGETRTWWPRPPT
ncbi:IS110 family transposase [Streptomyces sp. NRRL S-37]|uniref:IS110 family transposase n=1 Tax=Streptomyces sp. NRRL S-37 TaxID=1463903 RepID=UPI002D21A28C|nr:transposase [Streptomyces sp. NRRL S-37]